MKPPQCKFDASEGGLLESPGARRGEEVGQRLPCFGSIWEDFILRISLFIQIRINIRSHANRIRFDQLPELVTPLGYVSRSTDCQVGDLSFHHPFIISITKLDGLGYRFRLQTRCNPPRRGAGLRKSVSRKDCQRAASHPARSPGKTAQTLPRFAMLPARE